MASTAAAKPVRARPIQGWALEKLLLVDAAHPGILRYAIQASALRRQAIFLALSTIRPGSHNDLAVRLTRNSDLSTSPDPLETISLALMKRRVRDIVRALYPGVQGLSGALNRMGDAPLHPLKYRALIRILAEPDQRRAKVLRQLQHISEPTLTVLRIIEQAFLFPGLIRHFRSAKDAEAFAAAVKLIRTIVPGVTDEALLASLKALGPTSDLESWAQRWLAKAVFPQLPDIQDDADWRVLRSGAAMQDAAARFRNCMGGGDKIGGCALARTAFVEWLPEPAILELVAVSGPDGHAHLLQGIHGLRNGRVAPAVVQAICAKAAGAGLLMPAKVGHARQHNRAARLLNVYDFNGIHGLPDDDVTEIEVFLDELAQEAAA